jgi:hypothetical protein
MLVVNRTERHTVRRGLYDIGNSTGYMRQWSFIQREPVCVELRDLAASDDFARAGGTPPRSYIDFRCAREERRIKGLKDTKNGRITPITCIIDPVYVLQSRFNLL